MIQRLAAAARARPLPWTIGALCLLTFVPGLDIGFSGLFYDRAAGFAWNRGGVLAFVREAVPVMIMGSVLFCAILWAAGRVFRQDFWTMTTPRMGYLLATLAVGPGLLVETVLKSHWGRARPNDIVPFGGEGVYTPPLWIAQECAHNCSFVSGHAALGYWLSAYGFLLPARWRKAGVTAGMACGAGVGLVRVAQGAHFLSDVVFAGAFVLIVNALLARVMLRGRAA